MIFCFLSSGEQRDADASRVLSLLETLTQAVTGGGGGALVDVAGPERSLASVSAESAQSPTADRKSQEEPVGLIRFLVSFIRMKPFVV